MEGAALGLAAVWSDAMILIANQVASVLERVLNAWRDMLSKLTGDVNVLGHNLNPLSGIDTSHVSLGRQDLVDPMQGLKNLFPDITKPVKDLGAASDKTGAQLQDFGAKAKTAAEDAADGLSLLKKAATELFANPTKEEANLQVASDKFARLQSGLAPGAAHFGGDIGHVAQGQTDPNAARLTAMQAEDKLLKDQLTASDATLLSNKQRDQVYGQLLQDTRNVSTRIQETSDKLHLSLMPSIDDVHTIANKSGDVLRAIADVTSKQNAAAASTDRLSAAADKAAVKLSNIPDPAASGHHITPPDVGTGGLLPDLQSAVRAMGQMFG